LVDEQQEVQEEQGEVSDLKDDGEVVNRFVVAPLVWLTVGLFSHRREQHWVQW
jgi:hypothetical protein